MQINSLDQQICKEKYDTQKEPDMVPFASVPVVQILSSSDDDIGRYEYDADTYSEDNDGVQLHLTVKRHQSQELDKLCAEELTYYIDSITEKTTNTIKQFTTKDL